MNAMAHALSTAVPLSPKDIVRSAEERMDRTVECFDNKRRDVGGIVLDINAVGALNFVQSLLGNAFAVLIIGIKNEMGGINWSIKIPLKNSGLRFAGILARIRKTHCDRVGVQIEAKDMALLSKPVSGIKSANIWQVDHTTNTITCHGMTRAGTPLSLGDIMEAVCYVLGTRFAFPSADQDKGSTPLPPGMTK